MRGAIATTARAKGATRARPRARVRRDIPIPYYAQLARILENEISAGVWQPGDELPSEADLCETHGVSRTAVRQALGELASRGILHKQRGRRTAVAGMRGLVVQEMRGFSDEMSARGETVRTKVLGLQLVEAPPRIAHELGIPRGSKVVKLSRLRAVDHDTVVRVDTFLPAPRFEDLLDVDLASPGISLYAVLSERFGVRPSSGTRSIEAVAADAAVARQLGVPVRAPLLKLVAMNRDQDGAPFEVFHAWYRGDATKFELVVGS